MHTGCRKSTYSVWEPWQALDNRKPAGMSSPALSYDNSIYYSLYFSLLLCHIGIIHKHNPTNAMLSLL